jgi:hypothetical protein
MSDFAEVWAWTSTLKTSVAFTIDWPLTAGWRDKERESSPTAFRGTA